MDEHTPNSSVQIPQTPQPPQYFQQPLTSAPPPPPIPGKKSHLPLILICLGIILLLLTVSIIYYMFFVHSHTQKISSTPLASSNNSDKNINYCGRSKPFTLQPTTQKEVDQAKQLEKSVYTDTSKLKPGESIPSKDELMIEKAVKTANTAVTNDRTNPQTWETLGNVYGTLSEFNLGAPNSSKFTIASFNQALSIDPQDCPALMDLGIFYMSQNDVPNSLDTFKKVVHYYPNYESGYLMMATIYLVIGDTQDADKVFTTVLKHSPTEETKTLIANMKKKFTGIGYKSATPSATTSHTP